MTLHEFSRAIPHRVRQCHDGLVAKIAANIHRKIPDRQVAILWLHGQRLAHDIVQFATQRFQQAACRLAARRCKLS
jgi:hypothetical protein